MSLKMLQKAVASGTTSIFATSHLLQAAHNPAWQDFLVGAERLRQLAGEHNLPLAIYSGCEVFMDWDLLAFIDDVHANDAHKDKTIGKTFTLKFFTKRWQYIEHYKITRTEKGWDIRVLSDSYSSNKSMSPELNHLLDNDGVCYPKDINLFFE